MAHLKVMQMLLHFLPVQIGAIISIVATRISSYQRVRIIPLRRLFTRSTHPTVPDLGSRSGSASCASCRLPSLLHIMHANNVIMEERAFGESLRFLALYIRSQDRLRHQSVVMATRRIG